MKAEDVDAGLVEKAAREVTNYLHRSGDWIPPQHYQIARNALAAVLPQIQAQALRDEADRAHTYGFSTGDRTVFVHGERARHLLHERADRLTDTTGEPTT